MMILNYSLFYLVNNVIIISKIIIRYDKYVASFGINFIILSKKWL